MEKKDVKISIPYELAGKLSKKIKEVGFNTISEYIVYVLEQVLSSEDPDEKDIYEEEEEENVRERLKKLGYL